MSRQRRLDKKSAIAGMECALCGKREAALFGCFFPDKAGNLLLGTPPGKSRIVGYVLCNSCKDRPDAFAAVEERLMEELAVPERN